LEGVREPSFGGSYFTNARVPTALGGFAIRHRPNAMAKKYEKNNGHVDRDRL
jgi:hypothetical protein